jgi:HSP20 family molecular chaperone IbpA
MTYLADITGGKTPDYGKNKKGNGNMSAGNPINTRYIKSIEPEITLLDEGKFFRILAKLPGIAEEKIRIDLDKTGIIIVASDTTKSYRKVITLPCGVKFSKKRFSDGVLELILEKNCS